MMSLWEINNKVADFTVNKEKRTVVCVLQPSPDVTSLIANKYTDAVGLKATYVSDKRLWHPFIGIAKCHPNDEWNEEIGKKIARERAEKQLHDEINKGLVGFANRLRLAADLIEKYGVRK